MKESANQVLFDRSVKHYIQVRQYEKFLLQKQNELAKSFKRKVVSKLGQGLATPFRGIYRSYNRSLQRLGVRGAIGFLADESEFHTNNLRQSTGSFYRIQNLSKRDLRNSFLKTSVFNNLPLSRQFNAIGENGLKLAENAVKRGLSEGIPLKEILRSVSKSFDLTSTQSATLLRTTLTQAEVFALTKVAEKNADVIDSFEFTAILDSKTSAVCSSLDGRILKTTDTTLFPPRHYNCRSSLVPVLKGKRDLIKTSKNSTRFKSNVLKNLDSAEFNGVPSKSENFGTWLSRQDYSTKLNHLGSDQKVKLFEEGGLEVKDFFTSLGKPLGLKEIKLTSAKRLFGPKLAQRTPSETLTQVKSSRQLLNRPDFRRAVIELYREDSTNAGQPLSLVDFRGVTLDGKRSTRRRTFNVYDERNNTKDPFTGEVRSNLYYRPDFQLHQERLDYTQNSKLLSAEQKKFIFNVSESLGDDVSVNQKTAVVENLRLVLERKNRVPKEDWENLGAVLRSEMRFSVQNVSRRLDSRSRSHDVLFDPNGRPEVFILGDRYTFDNIIKDFRKDTQYIRDWKQKQGKTLARRMLYTGNSPFVGLFPKRDFTIKGRLKNAIEKIVPGVKQYRNLLKLKEQYITKVRETHAQEFIRKKKELFYRILNLELQLFRRNENVLDSTLGTLIPNADDQIDALASAMKLIAEGKSTDFDSLAIKLGSNFYENFGYKIPYWSTTLKDKHRVGSVVLNYLVRKKHIRINNRGTTRRSVIDLETGRPLQGGWKDTISREVEVLNPTMLEYQKRSRKTMIGHRIGSVDRRNDLVVRRGDIHYYNKFGERTHQRIVTTEASKYFDPKLIDQDVVNYINQGKSFKYTVDADFAPFMNRVLRFRDPRGNTEYWDSLNGFRRAIKDRGDQGEGLMQTALYHLERKKPFTTRAQIDSRGRLYFNGYLQPTGGEVVRPFLNTWNAKQITPQGVREIRYHLGSFLGDAEDKLSNVGREKAFKKFEKDLLELGAAIQSRTQPDRRVREFLSNQAVLAVDDTEVPMISRFALEYKRIWDHTSGDVFNPTKLKGYKTQLLNEIDATASVIQIISLATGNRNLAVTANLFESKKKNRIYDLVAQDTKADPRLLALEKRIGVEFSTKELSTGAKYAVMLRGYGSGTPGIAARLSSDISELLQKRDVVAVTRKEYLKEIRPLVRAQAEAERVGASEVAQALKTLKTELDEALLGSTQSARVALSLAEDYSPNTVPFVKKFLSPRSGRVNPEDFKELAGIMLEKLESRAPGMASYISFWKEASVSFIRDSKSVKIPLRTFDGKNWHLKFRPTVETEIRFWDPKSKRYVKNIYRGDTSDKISLTWKENLLGRKKNLDRYLGYSSISHARTGYGVSFTHANDSAILRLMYREAKKKGIEIASIHDAVVGNLEDTQNLRYFGRVAYSKAYQEKVIQKTLDLMLKKGLSKSEHKRLLELARKEGLLLNQFDADEITRRNGLSGYHYYGFDY